MERSRNTVAKIVCFNVQFGARSSASVLFVIAKLRVRTLVFARRVTFRVVGTARVPCRTVNSVLYRAERRILFSFDHPKPMSSHQIVAECHTAALSRLRSEFGVNGVPVLPITFNKTLWRTWDASSLSGAAARPGRVTATRVNRTGLTRASCLHGTHIRKLVSVLCLQTAQPRALLSAVPLTRWLLAIWPHPCDSNSKVSTAHNPAPRLPARTARPLAC